MARIDDETVTAGRLAAVAGPLVEIHGQREQAAPARRALAARAARRLRGPRRGARRRSRPPSTRWRANEDGARGSPSTPRSSSVGSRSFEHEVEEIAAARLRPGEAEAIAGPPRRVAARGGDRPRAVAALAGSWRHGDGRARSRAGPRPRRASRPRRRPRRPPPSPGSTRGTSPWSTAWPGSRRSSRTSPRRCAPSPSRSTTTRPRSRRSRSGCRRSTRWSAATGRTSRACSGGPSARRRRSRACATRPGERRRRADGRDRLLAEVADACAVLSAASAGRGRGPRRGGRGGRADAGPRRDPRRGRGRPADRRPDEPAVELDGDAVAFDATGRRRRRVPDRAEPRRAGPAAGPDRVRRRARRDWRSRSRRCSPTPTPRRRSSSTRSMPASAGAAPTRWRAPSGRSAGATRCCASRTCPRSRGLRRRPLRDPGRSRRPHARARRSTEDARRCGRRRAVAAVAQSWPRAASIGGPAAARRPARRVGARACWIGRRRSGPRSAWPGPHGIAAATDADASPRRDSAPVVQGRGEEHAGRRGPTRPAGPRAPAPAARQCRPARPPDLRRGHRGVPAPPAGRARALAGHAVSPTARRPAPLRRRRPEARGGGALAGPALAYLGRLASTAGPSGVRLRATSRRRRTAAIRAFYRFALAEDLARVDVAAHLDLPREPRLLPDPLGVDEVARLLEAAGPSGSPTRPRRGRRPSGRAPCWSSSTPPACASARRPGSTRTTSTSTPPRCG